MKFIKHTAILVMLTAGMTVRAQSTPPEIRASLEPDSVRLGDEVMLTIDVHKDQVQVIGFPVFDQQENGQLEVVEEYPVDTVEREGRQQHLRKRYRLAAFGEGTVVLGRTPVLYLDKNINDTLYSADSLSLYIEPIEIDTTTMTINDVKPPREMPLRFGEISGYMLRGLLLLVVLAGIVALAVWLIGK